MGEMAQSLRNQGKVITRQFISITSFQENERKLKYKTRPSINLEMQHFEQRSNE